jgi:hypothetical protein
MLHRAWSDVHKALTPAAVASDCTLALATITLLTTKHIKPTNMERFATLSSAELVCG